MSEGRNAGVAGMAAGIRSSPTYLGDETDWYRAVTHVDQGREAVRVALRPFSPSGWDLARRIVDANQYVLSGCKRDTPAWRLSGLTSSRQGESTSSHLADIDGRTKA